MAGERKTLQIHYRRLSNTAVLGGNTLEQSVRNAFGIALTGVALKDRASHRVYEKADESLLVNLYKDVEDPTLVFGDIVHFSRGRLQSLLDTGKLDDPSALVEQLTAPERKEYIHSIMYWMVKGNHAFLIQSTSLKSDTLEEYLAWLLWQKTESLKGDPGLVLAAKFDQDQVGGDLQDIQEVIIGGTVRPEAPGATPEPIPAAPGPTKEVEEHGRLSVRRLGQGVWGVLAELLGDSAKVDSIREAIPEDAELSVEVHIGYKTKRRKPDRAALRQLEQGLRNVPDSQIKVVGKDGTRSVDGKIRLHHSASIKLLKSGKAGEEKVGSLLDPTDVLRAMLEAYTNFVSNGKIEPVG